MFSTMSKRPKVYVSILDSDDDDDDLLNDTTTSFLRNKSPTVASLATPKNEEYLTPLGTATFAAGFEGDMNSIGQEVMLSLDDKTGVSFSLLHLIV